MKISKASSTSVSKSYITKYTVKYQRKNFELLRHLMMSHNRYVESYRLRKLGKSNKIYDIIAINKINY